jgi:hypothetical protein
MPWPPAQSRMVARSSRPSLGAFTDEASDTNSSVTALSRALGRAAHTHDYSVRLAKARDSCRLCRYCHDWSDGVESGRWNVALQTCFCVLNAIALLHEKSYPRVGFSPFSSLAWEVPNIVPRCVRVRCWQRQRIDLRRWTGTISREVYLFCWRSACVTGRTPCASDQLGKIWGKGGRSECTRRCALAR